MDTPRRMLAIVCLLLGVWIVTYWAYPTSKQKITRDEPLTGSPTSLSTSDSGLPKITTDAGSPTAPPMIARQPDPVPEPPRPRATRKVKKILAPTFREYIVQRGDVSMEKIASRSEVYGSSKLGHVVSQANPLVTPDKLKPGVTKLKIPVDPENIQGKEVWVDEYVDAPEQIAEPNQTALPPPIPENPKLQARTYVIQSSDTLSEISQKVYGKSALWRKIYEANKGVIEDPDRLKSGVTITIPPE